MNREQREASIYETAKDGAKAALAEGEEPKPIALSLTDDGQMIVALLPMCGSNPQQGRANTRDMLNRLTELLPFFATVNCLWLAGYTPGDDRPPSERPDRREGCLVQLYSGKTVVRRAMIHYRTQENGKTLLETDWIESDDVQAMRRTPSSIYPG